MPETTQTSPLQVQRAADLPPLKKSKPPKRSQLFQGFSAGTVSVSTTYAAGGSPFFGAGALASPRVPVVVSFSDHRGGPPVVRLAKSSGLRSLANTFLMAA